MLSTGWPQDAENRREGFRISDFGENEAYGVAANRALSILAWLVLVVGIVTPGSAASGSVEPDEVEFPSSSQVSAQVQRHFAQLSGWRPGHLIAQSDVRPVFSQLQQLGWQVSDQDQILSQLVPDSHFLVQTLRSRRGVRFMQQVAGHRLIYDRLDRIASESGGQRLIRDLIKLPDGARYAKQKPGRGVPEMTEFLPKNRSGKSRRVADYKKPTGKIYTARQFLERLQESYREDSRRAEKNGLSLGTLGSGRRSSG